MKMVLMSARFYIVSGQTANYLEKRGRTNLVSTVNGGICDLPKKISQCCFENPDHYHLEVWCKRPKPAYGASWVPMVR